jgi:thiosulfate/3-mercaptopyruvate sulfurtransferase
VADHLKDKNLVVVAIGNKAEYDEAHIPGSVFVDYMETHQMKSAAGLTLEMLPLAEEAEVFGKLGINNDSRVVLYPLKDWNSQTARIYVTLDSMGLGANASILDGGFLTWQREKRATSSAAPKVTAGKIVPCGQSDVVTDLDYVRGHVKSAGVAIVDARLPEYYTGATIPKGRRAGHVPGASNIPFSSLIDTDGKLLKVEALQAKFRDAGIKPGDRVVSYCHIGQQASEVYFVARYLGYDARLFDGSWEEWSGRSELPAETSAAATKQ